MPPTKFDTWGEAQKNMHLSSISEMRVQLNREATLHYRASGPWPGHAHVVPFVAIVVDLAVAHEAEALLVCQRGGNLLEAMR